MLLIEKNKNVMKLEIDGTLSALIVGIELDWACRNGCYGEKRVLKQMFDVVF